VSFDRCLEFVRAAGVPDGKARELCSDRNTQRCADAHLLFAAGTAPLRDLEAFDRWSGDLLACYSPDQTERST
jgi:hypothetical protein